MKISELQKLLDDLVKNGFGEAEVCLNIQTNVKLTGSDNFTDLGSYFILINGLKTKLVLNPGDTPLTRDKNE